MAQRLAQAIAAIVLAMAVIGCAAAAPTPLSVDDVVARLRTLSPTLTLVAFHDNPTGALPDLAFRAQMPFPSGEWPLIGQVLIFPTPAALASVRPGFGESSIQGPNGTENWDGMVHSVWVDVQNVLVEILIPPGQFGGRKPTAAELAFPGKVRAALEHAPTP